MKCLTEKPGIYKITCLSNDKIYVGSAKNLKKRLKEHLRRLKQNNHHSSYLQNCWNKYGELNFSFEILELFEEVETDKLVLKKRLLLAEQKFLDLLKPELNVCKIAGNTLGTTRTEETRRKLSGENHFNHSLTEEQVREIREKYKNDKTLNMKKLSLEYGVKSGTINGIIRNKKRFDKNYQPPTSIKERGLQTRNHHKGEDSKKAKLKKEEVLEIRRLYEIEKISQSKIAKMYKISQTSVSAIIRRKNWKDLIKEPV